MSLFLSWCMRFQRLSFLASSLMKSIRENANHNSSARATTNRSYETIRCLLVTVGLTQHWRFRDAFHFSKIAKRQQKVTSGCLSSTIFLSLHVFDAYSRIKPLHRIAQATKTLRIQLAFRLETVNGFSSFVLGLLQCDSQ